MVVAVVDMDTKFHAIRTSDAMWSYSNQGDFITLVVRQERIRFCKHVHGPGNVKGLNTIEHNKSHFHLRLRHFAINAGTSAPVRRDGMRFRRKRLGEESENHSSEN